MTSNFPRFKNSFSESASDKYKTRFTELSSDDFSFSNEIKTQAKFNLQNGGYFKTTNKITTKEQDGTATYNSGTDVELVGPLPHSDRFQGRLVAKEGKGFELQADLGQVSFKYGNLFPYLRLNLNTALTKPVPAAGLVWIYDAFKSHVDFNFKFTIDSYHKRWL